MPLTLPPLDGVIALGSSTTQVTRRMDIYEEDGVTAFLLDVPVVDGTISVDGTRDERRTLDCTLANIDGALDNHPDGFWYDKVIKVYRGVEWPGHSPSYVAFDGTGPLVSFDSERHEITSDVMSLRLHVAADDWNVANQVLFAKWQAGVNQRAWRLSLVSGRMSFTYSTTGTNEVTMASVASLGYAPGTAHWIGLDFVLDNGNGGRDCIFMTSTDGILWNELDIVTESTTGTVPLHNATIGIYCGDDATAIGSIGFTGKGYYFGVFDGTRSVVDLDLTNRTNGLVGMSDSNGQRFQFVLYASLMEGGLPTTEVWETQVGEFLIDSISGAHFPHDKKVKARDRSKQLMEVEFAITTTFLAGTQVADVVRGIATAGGVNRMVMPLDGQTLARDITFEAATHRWDAIKELALAYTYDAFFNPEGNLVLEPQEDPLTSPLIYTFETGEYGNLVGWDKSSADTQIFNQVIVRGESTETIPVVSIAENHEPSSPTSIENLKRTKTKNYSTPLIDTQAQADALARSMLRVAALENFDVTLSTLVVPWLEALKVVEFLDPDPNPGDPTRYLLTNFDIPMALGPMTATAKRITVVS